MKNIKKIIAIAILLALHTNVSFAEEKTVKNGDIEHSFSSWGKPSVDGSWKIINVDNEFYIELGESFRAKEGPDVKIFLSPLNSTDITGKNATNQSAFVYQITDFEGRSRIKIPSDIDIDEYQSLIFHCEAYSKLWGVSSLK